VADQSNSILKGHDARLLLAAAFHRPANLNALMWIGDRTACIIQTSKSEVASQSRFPRRSDQVNPMTSPAKKVNSTCRLRTDVTDPANPTTVPTLLSRNTQVISKVAPRRSRPERVSCQFLRGQKEAIAIAIALPSDICIALHVFLHFTPGFRHPGFVDFACYLVWTTAVAETQLGSTEPVRQCKGGCEGRIRGTHGCSGWHSGWCCAGS
jgi:hypothetical protein